MPTAEDVLAFFRRNAGLDEDLGVNRNWITEWYGMTGAWCAMSVSRALYEAGGESLTWLTKTGLGMTSDKGWAYVPYLRNDFENTGRFHEGDPQYGDVIIFDWEGDGWGDHTGVFERDLGDGTCLTWEGNTSNNLLEQRRRPFSLIAGFCRPPYDEQQPEGGFLMGLNDDEQAEALQLLRELRGDRENDGSVAYANAQLDQIKRAGSYNTKEGFDFWQSLPARLEALEKALKK